VKKLFPDIAFQHSQAPQLIEEKLLKLIKQHALHQKKSKLLGESEYSSIIKTCSQSSAEIARVLKVGYLIRGIADYEPEILVVFSNDSFSINEHSESEAKSWLGTVELHKGKLLKIAKELGLVS
jgi:hypothetical protein